MCNCQNAPSITVHVDNAHVTLIPSAVTDTALEALSRPFGAAKKFIKNIQEVAK